MRSGNSLSLALGLGVAGGLTAFAQSASITASGPASAAPPGVHAPAASVARVPIQLEAEDGALSGVYIAPAIPGVSGTGFVSGFRSAADSVTWTFEAPAGVYRLSILHRTEAGAPKAFGGALNDIPLSGQFPGSVEFINQRSDLLFTVEGKNVLRIGGGWSHYDIDAVVLVPDQVPLPPASVTARPVNARANAVTRRLLASLAENYGRVTLSGQQEVGDFKHISDLSNRLPAVLSGDLMDYTAGRMAFRQPDPRYIPDLIERGRAGHVLSLCWHWNSPSGVMNTPEQPWYSGFYTRATTFDLAAALAEPRGEDYRLLLADIDAIAAELKKFKDAGLPVLWRPLHESEGAWFWWGAKGPEPFKQLWRIVYERLTHHHRLDNLLWVLTSEDAAWYPGDDVVDIIGVDAYPPDQRDPLVTRWEALKERFEGRKLIALTEVAGVPDIETMHQRGVWWSYFASWTGTYGPATTPNDRLVRTYQSPAVYTLADLTRATGQFAFYQSPRSERFPAGLGPRR